MVCLVCIMFLQLLSSIAMGIDIKVALKALQNVYGVAGRFEVVNKTACNC